MNYIQSIFSPKRAGSRPASCRKSSSIQGEGLQGTIYSLIGTLYATNLRGIPYRMICAWHLTSTMPALGFTNSGGSVKCSGEVVLEEVAGETRRWEWDCPYQPSTAVSSSLAYADPRKQGMFTSLEMGGSLPNLFQLIVPQAIQLSLPLTCSWARKGFHFCPSSPRPAWYILQPEPVTTWIESHRYTIHGGNVWLRCTHSSRESSLQATKECTLLRAA